MTLATTRLFEQSSRSCPAADGRWETMKCHSESEDSMILRLTTAHENRIILSEAKNLALLRNGPMGKARARFFASLRMTAHLRALVGAVREPPLRPQHRIQRTNRECL